MILLHNIGNYKHSNYNSRAQIEAYQGPLSFDGIYSNVWENRDLLKDSGALLFIMGDYVGGNNDFDLKNAPDYGLKPETYCTWEQLEILKKDYGCRLAWHTWTHRNLCDLPDDEIRSELILPVDHDIEPIIAYPYGDFNERVIKIAKEMGYIDGYTVHQGNNGPFQRLRSYLTC